MPYRSGVPNVFVFHRTHHQHPPARRSGKTLSPTHIGQVRRESRQNVISKRTVQNTKNTKNDSVGRADLTNEGRFWHGPVSLITVGDHFSAHPPFPSYRTPYTSTSSSGVYSVSGLTVFHRTSGINTRDDGPLGSSTTTTGMRISVLRSISTPVFDYYRLLLLDAYQNLSAISIAKFQVPYFTS